jgi:hypothetical protein
VPLGERLLQARRRIPQALLPDAKWSNPPDKARLLMSSFSSFLHEANSFYGQLVALAAMHAVHEIEPLARSFGLDDSDDDDGDERQQQQQMRDGYYLSAAGHSRKPEEHLFLVSKVRKDFGLILALFPCQPSDLCFQQSAPSRQRARTLQHGSAAAAAAAAPASPTSGQASDGIRAGADGRKAKLPKAKRGRPRIVAEETEIVDQWLTDFARIHAVLFLKLG